MQPYVRKCWERAESAEANAELARDAEAKRISKAVAGKWRGVAASASSSLMTSGLQPASFVRTVFAAWMEAPLTAKVFAGRAPIRIRRLLFGKYAEIQYGSGS